MSNNRKYITDLLERYAANTASETEIRQLFLWLKETEDDSPLREQVLQVWTEHQPVASVAPVVHRVHFLKTSWFRYAAAVILLVGGMVWYKLSFDKLRMTEELSSSTTGMSDIAPGHNKAVLTVGGKKIDLSSDKSAITVGSAVTYNDGSIVLRQAQDDDAGRQMELKTPRGGQYQIMLPDGSKVWLNAASSIQFPSKFTGNNREVQITGEAYLEIAKNTKQPFIIRTNKTLVEVLGTSLNINAYEDEKVERTTLIEGSIRVKSVEDQLGASVILQPGQQARSNNNRLELVNNQSEAAIAWKNGLFNFEGSDLRTVMRQLERWYDIKVTYEGSLSEVEFQGKMYRNIPFSDVLEVLQKMGVKAQMEGKTVIIQ